MKQWRWSKRTAGLLLLAVMLVIMAGCQAMGGVDFNQMLKQAIKVTSFEGNETMEFKLLLKEDALKDIPAEEAEIMDLFSHIKLQLSSMKVAKAGQMSMNGKLELGAKSIGFSLKMNEDLAVVELEGAKSPFVLHLKEAIDPSGAVDSAASSDANLVDSGRQIVETFGGFAINNLPNPTHLSVDAGQETVGSETVTGMNIKAELSGKEIWTWIKTYLDALINDKAGLKTMLSGLFDIMQSQSGLAQSVGGESIFGSIPEEDDKADSVNEATNSLIKMLTDYRDQMKQAEKEDQASIDQIFNDQTSIKANVFVDSKLDIRKSTIEATIKPKFATTPAATSSTNDESGYGYEEMLADSPIEGIWLKLTNEMSNVNGSITPEAAVEPKQAVDTEKLQDMQGYEILRQFKSDSVAYGLLRNQAHISHQSVAFYVDEEESEPILTPAGVTLIPLRKAADRLGATLTRMPGSGTISVYDDATSTTVNLKVNSKVAVINGKTVTWSFPTTVVSGVTYVPVRDFAKALGATVAWENLDVNFNRIVISREP
ncbi:hypothetical protein Back11_30210 [Paenibacillus baekrokdamisoli]|uniref:Copper amine oxidase-like N-terminal domain-containing protein n=1 Tax=Paenibacillus baekrokdamisoli TaxID=1712516 RepID=A0A3G9ITG7_9BACL|nr:copper amine oxidase N-terminal domain-containing protein [Paenibacillus baekrokdamisoli]MBB3071260.1 hypothetical protein [Paenibacillus baekrokdamisoli]BBH21676.1 hypothetical protein Back11_30210 [Paenibacillus baekrokdamisoli]